MWTVPSGSRQTRGSGCRCRVTGPFRVWRWVLASPRPGAWALAPRGVVERGAVLAGACERAVERRPFAHFGVSKSRTKAVGDALALVASAAFTDTPPRPKERCASNVQRFRYERVACAPPHNREPPPPNRERRAEEERGHSLPSHEAAHPRAVPHGALEGRQRALGSLGLPRSNTSSSTSSISRRGWRTTARGLHVLNFLPSGIQAGRVAVRPSPPLSTAVWPCGRPPSAQTTWRQLACGEADAPLQLDLGRERQLWNQGGHLGWGHAGRHPWRELQPG